MLPTRTVTAVTLGTASGSTLARNTTDRNVSGITLEGESHDSTVLRNKASANLIEGIRLYGGPTENTIKDNTVTGNGIGIRLFSASGPVGASRNTLSHNTVTLNSLGIWLEQGSTGNHIQGNTALHNRDFTSETSTPTAIPILGPATTS